MLADSVFGIELGHPVRVGIDGVSAAGKTTLADELAAIISARCHPVIRISIDDFHNPGSVRYARGPLSPDGYYHDAFNYAAFRSEVLDPLGPGGQRRYRTACWDSFRGYPEGTPVEGDPQEASADSILLCDCIFALRSELARLWDFTVFLEVGFDETLRRALLRDVEWVGSADEVRRRWAARYVPAERMYLAAVKPQGLADVVIDNSDPAHPRLLR